jgi:hypothetical protein
VLADSIEVRSGFNAAVLTTESNLNTDFKRALDFVGTGPLAESVHPQHHLIGATLKKECGALLV